MDRIPTLKDTYPGTGGRPGVFTLAGEDGWWWTEFIIDGGANAIVCRADDSERRQVSADTLAFRFKPGVKPGEVA